MWTVGLLSMAAVAWTLTAYSLGWIDGRDSERRRRKAAADKIIKESELWKNQVEGYRWNKKP